MTWSPFDIKDCIELTRRVLRRTDDAEVFMVAMTKPMAALWLDYLQTLDPDMPPRPILKALGPLVGDQMMNAKLQRLDDLVDKLGPLVVLLERRMDLAEHLKRGRDV